MIPILLYRRSLQRLLHLYREFYVCPKMKVHDIWRLFCLVMRENAGFAVPFGIIKELYEYYLKDSTPVTEL